MTAEPGSTGCFPNEPDLSSGQDRFRVNTIQYNDNAPTILDNNYINVIYQNDKNQFSIKEQSFEMKGEIMLRILYDARKNQSMVIRKDSSDVKTQDLTDGLLLLKLLTSNGSLQTQY